MSISYIIYPSEKRRRAGNTLSGWQVQDVQHLPLQLEEHKCREPLREKKNKYLKLGFEAFVQPPNEEVARHLDQPG